MRGERGDRDKEGEGEREEEGERGMRVREGETEVVCRTGGQYCDRNSQQAKVWSHSLHMGNSNHQV